MPRLLLVSGFCCTVPQLIGRNICVSGGGRGISTESTECAVPTLTRGGGLEMVWMWYGEEDLETRSKFKDQK